jgi:chaperone required for assembly of F1-ATPase
MAGRGLRRFWTDARVQPVEGGHAVLLDGRPIRTPGRAPLEVPAPALAEAIAEEWRSAPPEVVPAAMRLTGLANAAIDLVAPDRKAFARRLGAYAECDTLCYRAEGPDHLVARQRTRWDPLLVSLERRLGVRMTAATGIAFVAQPPDALARVAGAYEALDCFRLAALSPVVTITASALLGLALVLRLETAEGVWQAGLLEELWQAEQWGEDADAEASRARRRAEFDAAARFLSLLA